MFKMYKTNMETNVTEETKKIEKGNWINMVAPTEDEIQQVCKKLKIQEDFIKYSLDYEEKARIDYEEDDDTTLFIVDVPIIEKEDNEPVYSTMPLGMIVVRDDYFITVSLKQNRIISELEKSKSKNSVITYKKSRMILQIFYKNAELYLKYLKKINKELLKMLSLEKSLVYFTTSLKSNEVVMEKTLRGKNIKLYDEDEDILDDAIIENKQAIEMAKIYSDILNGTMDAYGSIISNNLNGVMKFLTSITIILAIPTMVASYWGMNVNVPMQFLDSPWPFWIVVLISIILGIIAMIWLKRKDMLD